MPPLDSEREQRSRQFDFTVGANIRARRMAIGMDQQDLAQLADMDKSQLNRVEAGTRSLKLREALPIARALSIAPAVLAEPFN